MTKTGKAIALSMPVMQSLVSEIPTDARLRATKVVSVPHMFNPALMLRYERALWRSADGVWYAVLVDEYVDGPGMMNKRRACRVVDIPGSAIAQAWAECYWSLEEIKKIFPELVG